MWGGPRTARGGFSACPRLPVALTHERPAAGARRQASDDRSRDPQRVRKGGEREEERVSAAGAAARGLCWRPPVVVSLPANVPVGLAHPGWGGTVWPPVSLPILRQLVVSVPP